MIPKRKEDRTLLESLDDVICTIRMARVIRLVPTEKNRKTKLLLGLTDEDLKDLIRSLKKSDYYRGPETDHNGSSGSIWVFRKREYGEWFYIKIKYVEPIKALSCHIEHIE